MILLYPGHSNCNAFDYKLLRMFNVDYVTI